MIISSPFLAGIFCGEGREEIFKTTSDKNIRKGNLND